MVKLSVIIPIYNASRYIVRCLESVEKQTLCDMEVILVDDHGTDDSITLAKAFAGQSKRKDIVYRFIATPQNSGPALARNIGLKEAKGEYVAFLDADDWVESEMYETLYKNAKVHEADLSCSNAIMEFEDGRMSKTLKNPVVRNESFTIIAKKHFLTTYVAYIWSYIYRREWLLSNQLLFANAKSSEDSSFLACCILVANRIAQTNKHFYHYFIHSGSLTQRKVWKGRDKRQAFGAMWKFAKRKGLLRTYWLQLGYVYLKKAMLVPILEMIQ